MKGDGGGDVIIAQTERAPVADMKPSHAEVAALGQVLGALLWVGYQALRVFLAELVEDGSREPGLEAPHIGAATRASAESWRGLA